MNDDEKREYQRLEAAHRELERDVQTRANEERINLRDRVETLEKTYWKSERLEVFFDRVHDRLDGHDKKFWLAQGAWAAILFALEMYHKFGTK